MTRRGYFIRLAISVVIDIADFVIGAIPGVGIATDGVATIVLTLLWGRAGLAYAWEVIDIIEPNARTVEALNRLVVPAGVFIKIKA